MSCKKKKKKLSGWAPRCCGYTYSFLATRMTITTRYTTHNIALIYFTLRTSKINKYILSNLKIGEFFPNPYVYFNNLYLNDTVFGIKIAWRNIRYIYIYIFVNNNRLKEVSMKWKCNLCKRSNHFITLSTISYKFQIHSVYIFHCILQFHI